MRKIIEVQRAKDVTALALTQQINSMIKLGFQPYGNFTVEKEEYIILMVKYDDEVIENTSTITPTTAKQMYLDDYIANKIKGSIIAKTRTFSVDDYQFGYDEIKKRLIELGYNNAPNDVYPYLKYNF